MEQKLIWGTGLVSSRIGLGTWAKLLMLTPLVVGIVVSVTAFYPQPGYPANCTVAAATPENTQSYPSILWDAAEYGAQYSPGDPPTLIVQPFTASQAVLQEGDEFTAEEAIDNLGGCYGPKENLVQMNSGAGPPAQGNYVLIHELVHAKLHQAGIPVEMHHCWMAEHNVSGRILGWMAKTLGVSPDFYPQARFSEIVACGTSFRLEFPPEGTGWPGPPRAELPGPVSPK